MSRLRVASSTLSVAALAASCLTLLHLASCSGSRQTTRAPERARAPAAGAPRGPATGAPAPARAPSIEPAIVGWATIAGLDGLSDAVATYAGGQSAADVRAAMLGAFGVPPPMMTAIAGDRPLVLALVDPEHHGGPDVPPLVAALPIGSADELVRALDASFPRATGPDARDGVLVWERPGGSRLFVTIDRRRQLAYVAFERALAAGAPAALERRALATPTSAVVVRAAVDRLRKLYGPRVEETIAHLMAFLSIDDGGADPQAAYAMRNARRALEFLPEASALELRIDLAPEGLALGMRMEAQKGGAFAQWVGRQRTGPSWGVELVPEDAVLVFSSHTSDEGAVADAEALAAFAGSLSEGGASTAGAAERWRTALGAAASSITGDIVYAVWPAAGGGMGVGGAFRVAAPDQARLRTLDAYVALRPVLGRIMAAQLGMDPTRVDFEVTIRRGGARVAGTPVDLVHMKPKFPKGADAERKVMKWLYGDRITLGLTSVGDTVVYASGRDWRPRLTHMVRAARGQDVASIADTPAFATAGLQPEEGRVSLVFLSAPGMITIVRDYMRDVVGLAPAKEAMMQRFLQPGREHSALIATTRVIPADDGHAAYEVATFLPASALVELGGVGGALWRVALAALVGPPSVPPLPAPPPTVTPPPSTAEPQEPLPAERT